MGQGIAFTVPLAGIFDYSVTLQILRILNHDQFPPTTKDTLFTLFFDYSSVFQNIMVAQCKPLFITLGKQIYKQVY